MVVARGAVADVDLGTGGGLEDGFVEDSEDEDEAEDGGALWVLEYRRRRGS